MLAQISNQELVSYSWIFPNVVTNGHWWYSNIPAYIELDCRSRLQAVPQTKQIGYYSDMYKLEFALPKFRMYRRILASVLAADFVMGRHWSETRALDLGRLVLRGNVQRIFRDQIGPETVSDGRRTVTQPICAPAPLFTGASYACTIDRALRLRIRSEQAVEQGHADFGAASRGGGDPLRAGRRSNRTRPRAGMPDPARFQHGFAPPRPGDAGRQCFIVEDLGSGNGTFLNGKRIAERTPLKSDDRLKLGPILLRFETGVTRPQAAAAGSNRP